MARSSFLGRILDSTYGWFLIAGIVGALAVAVTATWQRSGALSAAEQSARAVSELYEAGLDAHLDKFRFLPALIARRPDVHAVFSDPDIDAARVAAVAMADMVSGLTGALDIRFIRPDGIVIARGGVPASEGLSLDESRTTHFREAMQGRLGRGHSAEDPEQRAYHFAFAVRNEDEIAGVVAVDVSLESVEQAWALSLDPVFVTDQNGIIFLSNRPEWLLRPLSEVAAEGSVSLTPRWGEPNIAGLEGPSELRDRGAFLVVTRDMPLLDWRLYVLTNLAPITASWLGAGFLAAVLSLLLISAIWVWLERKRRDVALRRKEKAMALRLERKVRERTRELTLANSHLGREIEERVAAEKELRATQAELIQAGKLATIGQMSAALSHEFNQPLAAIRFHAENAEALIERRRQAEARDNLGRIVSMVDRMSRLSKTLKTFSSKPRAVHPVSVRTVLDEVSMMLSPRLASAGISLTIDGDVLVMGDLVRLSQIFMNILANAVDALEDSPARRIRVSAVTRGEQGVILIRDSGPGVSESALPRLFEPFFTTKEVGKGLGLGLSIAYRIVKDLGGFIEVRNHPESGAEFTLVLPLAAAPATPGPEMADVALVAALPASGA